MANNEAEEIRYETETTLGFVGGDETKRPTVQEDFPSADKLAVGESVKEGGREVKSIEIKGRRIK